MAETDAIKYPDAVFASMGMFIIDEIHFPNKPSQYNVLGGGGTFSVVGSRMVLTAANSRMAGWILDIGNDFPPQMLDSIKTWDTGVIMRHNENRQCTHGWNMYGDNDFRSFKYLTPKLRIEVPDIIKHNSLLHSKSYHLLCSPERCTEILGKLRPLRPDEPIIVWEPIPDNFNPETLQRCLDILSEVDILSPNAQEAAAFFGLEEPTERQKIEAIADRFLPYMTKSQNAGVVLRCGALGCFVASAVFREWFPAYHSDPSAQDYRVVDPTGGGNTFIGALATAYVLSDQNWSVASIAANVASGAAIEQIGMPQLASNDSWNGLSFAERIAVYLSRNPQITLKPDTVLASLGLH